MKLHTIILLTLCATLLGACQPPVMPDGRVIEVGDVVPAFRCETLDGGEFDSRETGGIPTVLVFFNTYCTDCEEELPELQRFHEMNMDYSARLMLVGRDEEPGRISKYWGSHGLSLPVCAGNSRKEYSLFANSGIPRIYIYDKDGVVRRTYGPDDRPAAEAIYEFTESLEHVRPEVEDDPMMEPDTEMPC